MTYYENLSCPVCGKQFDEHDDMVVCPVCGAPHHRACWKTLNHCAHESTHGTSEQWQRPKKDDDEDVFIKAACPRCGHKNDPGTVFCTHCGMSLGGDVPEQGSPAGGGQEQRTFSTFAEAYRALNDPYGGVEPTHTFNDVSAADMVTFIGPNSGYYLPRFYQMQQNGTSLGVNFASGFLSWAWLIFRRMSLPFLIVFFILFLLDLPTLALDFQYFVAGLKDLTYFSANYTVNPNLYHPSEALQLWANIFWYASVTVKIVLFVFGNRLYMNHVIKSIKQIKTETTDPLEYHKALTSRGGVRLAPPLFILLAGGLLLFAGAMFYVYL